MKTELNTLIEKQIRRLRKSFPVGPDKNGVCDFDWAMGGQELVEVFLKESMEEAYNLGYQEGEKQGAILGQYGMTKPKKK